MILALYILAALVGVGAVLYFWHRLDLKRHGNSPAVADTQAEEPQTDGEVCCGMHITCEKDSLLAAVSPKIEYYDDEELDRLAGRDPETFTDDEIEELRSVMLTLLPADIAGWARSIQLRGIRLPQLLRDELIMIVAEARAAHAAVQSPTA